MDSPPSYAAAMALMVPDQWIPIGMGVLVPVGVAVVIGVVYLREALKRRALEHDAGEEIPLLLIPQVRPLEVEPPALPGRPEEPEPPATSEPAAAQAEPAEQPVVAVRPLPTPGIARPLRPLAPPPPPAPPETEVDVTGATVSIDLTSVGTLQLLPGRLEVVRGMDAGREFRFVRAAGQEVTEVTVGRAPGPVHRHVQLPVPTVSRMHARLCYARGSWTITNLSRTNPVRVNERELFDGHESRPLASGDRIQLGEVELRFWEDG